MGADEIDRKILNALLDDSKLSYREIAKTVGVSVVTIMKRVKALEKSGVIKAYTTDLDYEQLGYDVSVIIKMKISKGKLLDVEKKVANNPNVYAVYDITGTFDSIVIAKFKNRRSLDTFLKKLQAYDFVERSETNLILNTIKEQNIKVS